MTSDSTPLPVSTSSTSSTSPIGVCRKSARDLLVELRPVAARNHRDLGDAQELRDRRAHLGGERLLAFRQGSVEIEGDEFLHDCLLCSLSPALSRQSIPIA